MPVKFKIDNKKVQKRTANRFYKTMIGSSLFQARLREKRNTSMNGSLHLAELISPSLFFFSPSGALSFGFYFIVTKTVGESEAEIYITPVT